MSDRWSERVEGHETMRLLDELVAVIRAVPSSNPDVTPESLSYLHRAERVLAYFRARLHNTERALLTPYLLDRAAPHLQNARGQVDAFVSSNNEDYLRTVDAEMDGLLNEMPSFPPLPFNKEATAAREAAESYSQRLVDIEADIRNRVDALATQMDSTSTDFAQRAQAADERLTAVTTAAAESAARIESETETHIAEVRGQIDTQVARLDAAITQTQGTFSEAQERRLAEFAESQTKREEAFGTRVDELMNSSKAVLDDLVAKGQSSVRALEEQEDRAAQIVGITAASVVTGAYMKEAAEQRSEADKWRYWALGSALVLLIYLVVMALRFPPGHDLSATGWLTYWSPKLPFGIVVTAVFPYLMRQSGGHRQRERSARRMAMELTAFRPFLSELDEADRKKLIAEAQRRFFPGYELNETSSEVTD